MQGNGGNDAFQLAGTTNNDTFAYTANASDGGTISQTAGGPTVNFVLSGIQSASLDAKSNADSDSLTVTTANATITPGSEPGSGTVQPVDAFGASLLPLSFSNVENASVTGAAAVIQGTAANDTIEVLANGNVKVTNALGFSNTIDVSAFNSLVINALAGDDNITIDAGAAANFAGGIQVIGGDNGGGSDNLIYNGNGNNIGVDLGSQTIQETGVGYGPVSFTGVETISVNGGAGDVAVTDPYSSDNLDVWTTSATQATVSVEGSSSYLVVNTSGNFATNFTGSNQALNLMGTANSDAITATAGHLQIAGLLKIDYSGPSAINIDGAAGNDTLIVDNSLGLLTLPGGLNFAGGSGQDLLQLIGSTSADVTYSPGSTPDAGTVMESNGGTPQIVNFTGVEPVQVVGTGGADTLTVANLLPSGLLNADNAINYTAGPNGGIGVFAGYANTGLVSVDSAESIEFANYGALTINAGAGDDTINLNNANTPTALASITINAGDPTASDTLIVNGRVNTADVITYTPATTTSDTGSVAITGLPVVNFTTTEHLVINGQNGGPGGAGDSLTIATNNLSSNQTEILTPGSTFDSGHVDFRDRPGGTNPTAVPVDFLALGVAGSVTFSDIGRSDNLIYNGTALDDNFAVNAAGQVVLNTQIPVNTSSINTLTLAGLSGDDTFNIAGNHNLPGIAIEGGDPSASDVVNFTGDGTNAVTVDLGAGTVQEAGFGAVSLSGVETLNVNAGGAALNVDGTAGNDDLTVTPTGGNAGTLQDNAVSLAVNYLNVAANTVNVDFSSGGLDTLVVNASALPDTVGVDVPSGTVNTGAGGGIVDFGAGARRPCPSMACKAAIRLT